MLTATLSGELDEIRNVETKMNELTGLLSTFTNLIQEQHSQIDGLHSITLKSKDYLESGEEDLLKAKERGESGTFWVAYLIVFLGEKIACTRIYIIREHLQNLTQHNQNNIFFAGFALLFLNWFLP